MDIHETYVRVRSYVILHDRALWGEYDCSRTKGEADIVVRFWIWEDVKLTPSKQKIGELNSRQTFYIAVEISFSDAGKHVGKK